MKYKNSDVNPQEGDLVYFSGREILVSEVDYNLGCNLLLNIEGTDGELSEKLIISKPDSIVFIRRKN
ncbi:hypothetical protein AB6D63_02660 [Vibrio splendidus]